jgi:hypothetical protein
MKTESQDRYSLALLVSILFFLVLGTFLEENWISQVFMFLSMYATLIVAILKLSQKRAMPWPALLLTISSLLVTFVTIFHPVHTLRIANWLLLSAFLGYVSVALFAFLEHSGAIIRAKSLSDTGTVLFRCL